MTTIHLHKETVYDNHAAQVTQVCVRTHPEEAAQDGPWQAPLSMEISRQEYWSGLPLPTPGNLPDPGIKLASPAVAGSFFNAAPPGKPNAVYYIWRKQIALWSLIRWPRTSTHSKLCLVIIHNTYQHALTDYITICRNTCPLQLEDAHNSTFNHYIYNKKLLYLLLLLLFSR